MKKKLIISMVYVMTIFVAFTSCKKDEEQPTTGNIEGFVTDMETGTALADVRIIVFDANTNSPTGETYFTNSEGKYTIEIEAGTFYLKLYKLGYESIPRQGMTPLPLNVELGNTLAADFELSPSEVIDGGIISGKITSGDKGMSGVLVVAEDATNAYSSVTDASGNYFIYNVPAGTYTLKGWLNGYNSNLTEVTIATSEELRDVNLELTAGAAVSVSGIISFLATENVEVDVALVHPKTKETIPGLTTRTIGGNYILENVPDGDYIGRASYENDGLVIDPDWVVKFGEPTITVAGASVELNFSVTGAVSLISPTNDSSLTLPVDVSLDTLQFSWTPYPSSSDYVIEVMDLNGKVIWGGFSNGWTEKNIVIPDMQTSVEYNYDNTALADLEPGKTYRWRIFASRDDRQSATGWRLISVSEDQMGLIKIVE
jgi:hypothetical protein